MESPLFHSMGPGPTRVRQYNVPTKTCHDFADAQDDSAAGGAASVLPPMSIS